MSTEESQEAQTQKLRNLSLRAKLKTIREQRKPVHFMTGEELESRFDGWAIAKREQLAERTPEQNARIFRLVVLSLVGVLLFALAVATMISAEHHTQQVADNANQASTLEQQVAAAQAPRDDKAQQEALVDLAKAATTKAESVAELQHGFSDLYRKADDSSTPADGVPSKQMQAVADHRRGLAEYFEKGSYVVSDDEAYQWSTAVSHGPEEIDPRYAWYVAYDGVKASPGSASSWKVASAMPVVDKPGTAHVVWSCTDVKTGQVLAWASADFSTESDRFSDLELAVTASGTDRLDSRMATSDDRPAELAKPKKEKKDEKSSKSDKDNKNDKGKQKGKDD